MPIDINAITEKAARESLIANQIRQEIGRVIVGQDELVERLLVALLCNSHVLIEGLPGLAKSLTVTSLARAIDSSFHRIQFTPDLLPGDLIGTLIYNPKSGEFTTRKGPIFTNIILADEINRAPAKVQSALLEAMQERQVSIGDHTYPLGEPFMVLATQNPVDQEGTYPLPEAQMDRFMLKLTIGYPSREEEREILRRMAASTPLPALNPVISPTDISRIRQLVDEIYMDEKIEDYIINLIAAGREPESCRIDPALIRYGASPRATIYLAMGARAMALLAGRGYVIPQDVKSIAPDILRHRLAVSYEAEAEGKSADDIVQMILDRVEVP